MMFHCCCFFLQDIVLTTYGTLAAELNPALAVEPPLLATKWLRVCLDEGHQIKNHRTKQAKAAAALDTERRWIISETPIQVRSTTANPNWNMNWCYW